MLQADRSWKKNSFKDLQFLAAKKILLRFQLDREEVYLHPSHSIYLITFGILQQITLSYINYFGDPKIFLILRPAKF